MLAEVAQGLLEAMKVGTFNFTNLLICIYELDQAALALYMSIEMLENAIKDKDVSELIPAVIGAIAFVQGLKQALPVCMQVDEKSFDWTTANQITSIAEDPEKHLQLIGKNLIFNGVSITSDLHKAIDAYRSGEFEKFGWELGTALTLATLPEEDLFLF
jgi:hypothetical protein